MNAGLQSVSIEGLVHNEYERIARYRQPRISRSWQRLDESACSYIPCLKNRWDCGDHSPGDVGRIVSVRGRILYGFNFVSFVLFRASYYAIECYLIQL